MRKKLPTTNAGYLKKISLTICLTSFFLSHPTKAASEQLKQVNENLQAIFKQINKKYAAHNEQQAQIAAQAQAAEIAAEAAEPRQTSDTSTDEPVPGDNSLALSDKSRFAPGEELILEASSNATPLTSIFAIKSEKGLQIGLSDFVQIVEFPITVNLDSPSAEGWFFSEKNHFSLSKMNDGRLEITANGKTFYVASDDYQLNDDLWVEMADLAHWFGLSYDLNEERLLLAINSKNKFPAELRQDRLSKKNIASNPNSKSVLPLKNSNYRAFSPPMLDIQTWAGQSETVTSAQDLPSGDRIESDTYKSTSANYSILASHDLAYLNTEFFVAGSNNDSLQSARLTMSRQSDNSDLLGPLRATEYAFGDVTPVNAGLGNTQGLTRGFTLGNTPVNQLADNRKVNITGEIQTGWDIELYRNGILIDQRIGTNDGYYQFNDVQLEYGNNDFELVFYGPQGQRETKTESYVVDSNNVLAGQGMYRFSLVEVGKTVFDVDQITDNPTQQGIMGSTVFDYGVTDWLAFSAGSSVFEPKLGDTQQFFTLGTSASMGAAGLLSARVLQDNNNLQSSDVNYRTRVLNTSYTLGYRTGESLNATTNTINTTDTYNANMSGQLFTGSWLPIAYQNAWQRTEDKERDSRNEYYQNSIGIGNRLGYFTNNLTLQKDVIADPLLSPTPVSGPEDYLTGSLQYRKSFGRLHTRLFNNYTLQPVKDTYAYGGILNYSWTQNFNSELRYSYYAIPDQYQINFGMNWHKDAFYLSTQAGYNEDGSWSAGLGLRFSLGYEPIKHSVFTSAQPIAQSGAVAVRVFEDLNMNGSFDENEPPMENATVKAVQAYRQEKTNASGVAVLSSIYNNTTTDIVVDESTLDGPFMINATPGVAIKARKGFVETVELPVVKAGEVDGIIYQKEKGGDSNPAPYIMLNLLDKNKKIAASTRSEFDGYYLFTNVKPGNYQLKVDENFVEQRGLKSADKNLDFSSDGDVIAGVDFVLRPLDEAAGYVASAGKFESPEMLKLYYHLLRKKLGNQFIQTPFYIKHPNKGGYELGLAYFAGVPKAGSDAEKKAGQACIGLSKHKIQCEVQYHDFKY